MLITCENCNKIFEIDSNLIPSKGRLLQCGSCNHKWFFKQEKPIILKKTTKINLPKKIKKNDNLENKENLEKKEIKKTNFFKMFLVLLITFSAIIILLDTFKNNISTYYPNIDKILNNLYESLKDIYLFFKDLIN